MNRDVRVSGPGAAIGANALHDPSGVGVFPVRRLIATLEPGGVLAVHWIVCQLTTAAASKTREQNVPEAAYGDRRIQSTAMAPPKVSRSLPAIGRIAPVIATGCVTTSAPST